MIGLLVGLFSILAIMMLYKVILSQSATMKKAANQDGNVSSAFLTAQMEIQKAGFGLEAATNSCNGPSVVGPSGTMNTDLILLSTAQLNAGTLTGTTRSMNAAGGANVSGNAILWNTTTSGANTCTGIVAQNGGLVLIKSAACTAVANWGSAVWTSDELIPSGQLAGAQAAQMTAVQTTACQPYGKGAASTGVNVTLSAGLSTNSATASQSICLPNICK